MPPYGLYSLANTPEELLNRGYGYGTDIPLGQLSEAERNIIFTQYDPAFGNLNTDFGYFGAPYTGARPFQNTGFLRADRQYGLGFDANIDNPSFGGVSGYRDTGGIMNIEPAVKSVDKVQRFQAPLGFDTTFRVANEPDEEQVEFLGDRPNKVQTGIAKLFEFLQRFSPIATIGRGLESLRNKMDTRRAIRDDIIRDTQGDITTFDPAKTRNRQRIMNMQPSDRDRARGSTPSRSTPSRSGRDTSPSSSYSQASYDRRR